jgi:LPXTG-motif cell wall-anchored protein
MFNLGGGRVTRKVSASLIALMTGVVVTAFAVPVSATATGGPYGGFASGTVAHVHALDVMATKVANVELGQSNAAVASEGFPNTGNYNEFDRPILPAGFGGKNSYGQGSVAEVGLGVTKTDANQIAPFVSQVATSSGHHIDDKDPVHVPGSPLLWLDALHTTAVANWNTNTCVIGEPISAGFSRAAAVDAVNIDPTMATNADDSFKQALAHAGVVESTSFEQLYKGAGPGLGLASVAMTHAVHLVLLKGTANEFTVDVAPAFLVVKVDGTHHANKKDNIDYFAPLVRITPPGADPIDILPSQVGPIDIQIPPAAGDTGSDLLLRLKLGTLLPLTSSTGPKVTGNVNAAGTVASGTVNVLDLQVLNIPEIPAELARVSIGHLEAAAQVPAGGINCPIPVTKTPDVTQVESGQSFTTTIKVDNPWSCPLVLSKVTDQIDTIEGTSTFQVTSATPNPSSPSLPTADGLSSSLVTWSSGLPTIPPGGSATFTVTLKTGGGAGKIKDIATAEGAVSNCKPAPGSGETTVTGITNVKVPVTGTGTLTVPETKVLGVTLPKTGIADGAYSWAGILMLLAAVSGGSVLRRRKFKLEE